MKKSLVLIVGVLVLILVACSSKETESTDTKAERTENLNNTGMPIVNEEISLDFFAGQATQSASNWNDVMLFNEYEGMTNIDIQWEMVPSSGLSEKRNLRLVSDNLPDAFHSASVPVNDILKYGQQGVFIPLNDLIDKYAPNLKEIFEEYPEIEKGITFPDGNIYSFPRLVEPDFLSSRLSSVPWINQEWLESLDMDMPQTTEEFYQYLKAVKEEDPGDNNGIPYGSGSMDEIVNWLEGSFGVANQGSANPNIDVDPEDGEALRFYPISEGYKELLQYVHKLYEEELIEQNIFSIETNQFLANGSEGLYGSTNWYGPIETFGEEGGEPLVGIPALEGPHGDKMITKIVSPVNTVGSFLITKENQYPEATVRWIDHFYGKEGLELFFLGLEGVTFEEKPDGSVDFIDEINEHPDGLSFEEAVSEYLTFPGGGYPSMATQEFYRGGASSEKRLATAELLKPDVVKDPWTNFIYTEKETKVLDSTGNDIEKYVKEMRDKFISGQISFDEWDQYVETIEDLRLDDYMKVKKEAYERQKGQ